MKNKRKKQGKRRRATTDTGVGRRSLDEYYEIRRIFMKRYPRTHNVNGDTCEFAFSAFFALIVGGVMVMDSPVRGFFALRLEHFSSDLCSLRIQTDSGGAKKERYPAQRVYLSVEARVYLLGYLMHICLNNPQQFNGEEGELVPHSLSSPETFKSLFEEWLTELCEQASVPHMSLRDLLALARLDLRNIYPPFVIASLTGGVRHSPVPDDPLGGRLVTAFDERENATKKDPQDVVETVPAVIHDIAGYYDGLLGIANSLSQSSTQEERAACAKQVEMLIANCVKKHGPGHSSEPDISNFFMAGRWFATMLSYGKLSANTVKNYFGHVSAILRTALQGEFIDGLSHEDAESILEEYEPGSFDVAKWALKSFLGFSRNNFKVNIGDISWKLLNKSRLRQEVAILWPSAVRSIIDSCEEELEKLPVILGFHCGLRPGEITALVPLDLQIDGDAFINVRKSKTRSGKRRLPLSLLFDENLFAEFLVLCGHVRGSARERLFTTKEGTPFRNPQVLSKSVERRMAKAGYPWATFYTLRHSFASLLLLRLFRASFGDEWFSPEVKAELRQFDVRRDRELLKNGLSDIAALLGHADVRTAINNYVHTVDLLQQAFLRRHESTCSLLFSYEQGKALSGFASVAGLYKRIPAEKAGSGEIRADRLAKLISERLGRKLRNIHRGHR